MCSSYEITNLTGSALPVFPLRFPSLSYSAAIMKMNIYIYNCRRLRVARKGIIDLIGQARFKSPVGFRDGGSDESAITFRRNSRSIFVRPIRFRVNTIPHDWLLSHETRSRTCHKILTAPGTPLPGLANRLFGVIPNHISWLCSLVSTHPSLIFLPMVSDRR